MYWNNYGMWKGRLIMKRIGLFISLCLIAVSLAGCCFHSYVEATCSRPAQCKKCGSQQGDTLPHIWIEADCVNPVRCEVCSTTKGTALGHTWNPATCEEAKYCEMCGTHEGVPLGHNWVEETATSPHMCTNCGLMDPMALPENGAIISGERLTWGCTLTIHSSTQKHCYVKMKDASKTEVLSFFVRAGHTAEIYVPSGHYYVYFSYGDDWFGPQYVFGPKTSYGMDDELTDYTQYCWEYTLIPSANGNFSETPISADEF